MAASIRMIKTFSILITFLTIAPPAFATSLLRDADIEHAFSELARPILQIAGLRPDQVKVMLVDDAAFNAFVIDRHHIFLNVGLVLKTESAEMLQSVIAHEVAHIANGHLSRRKQNMQATRNAARFGLALALATGKANNNPGLGTGLAIGMSNSAQRVFNSHTQSEEIAADQTALMYFSKLGIDPKGALQVLDYLSGQEYLASSRQDPYARTHPLSRDRLRSAKAQAQVQKPTSPNPNARFWHARAVAKTRAFSQDPDRTLAASGTAVSEDIAFMQRAIAFSRRGKLIQALKAIEKAQKIRPTDPFFQDLKAELLMRNRQFSQAANAYAKAVSMAPDQSLILAGQGRALLASGQTESALQPLKKAYEMDFKNITLLHDLALAYAKLENQGMASLITAERFGLKGNLKDAMRHAKKAVSLLPQGSPPWQRAQDIVNSNQLK